MSQFCERRFVNHTVWWGNVAACIYINNFKQKKKKKKKTSSWVIITSEYIVYLTNKRR